MPKYKPTGSLIKHAKCANKNRAVASCQTAIFSTICKLKKKTHHIAVIYVQIAQAYNKAQPLTV